jgi:TRAP-type mannitol/chloroaromatic compound transport system permease small subunit
MSTIVRAIEGLSRLCGGVAAALVLMLVVLMLYDVLLRYAFNAPTLWGFEVSTWTMGAAFTLAIGYALACDAHVRVDLLYGRIPRKVLTLVDLVFLPLLLVVVAWLTWGLWHYFFDAYRTGEKSGGSAWNPRVWPFRLIVLAGFAAFTLQIVASILKTWTKLMAGAQTPDAGSDAPHGV